MELLSLPVAVFSAVATALFTRRLRKLWLRLLAVVAAAYVGAFLSSGAIAYVLRTEAQFGSFLLHLSFGVGSVVGVGVLLVSQWLLKPRGPHAG